MELVKVRLEEINILSDLASSTCKEYYPGIISEERIEYFCDNFLTVNSLTDSMNNGFLHYFAVEDEQIIGFCSFQHQENSIFLSKMYIVKEKRGKKYGSLMMEKIISLKHDDNINRIYLKVHGDNTNSIEFYKKHGFVISEKCASASNKNIMDNYIMERAICFIPEAY